MMLPSLIAPPSLSSLRALGLILAGVIVLQACAGQQPRPEVLGMDEAFARQVTDAYDTPPRVTRSVDISYPGVRLREGEDGHTTVRFTVDTNGRVTDFKSLSASHPAFSGYVKDRLRLWRFDPATLDGQPVPATLTRTFIFDADGGRKRSAPEPAPQRDDDGPRVVQPVGD